jgi:hypothetical protein
MNALDHYPLEDVKEKARAAAKIRPKEGVFELHTPAHREPPI